MKRTFFKLTIIVFGVCLLSLIGCGDDDFGGDYIALVSFQDNDESVLTLDMVRSQCSSGDLADSSATDIEPYTDVLADITITASENAVGMSLNSYTIEYLPELSEDGTHTLVLPPTLNSLLDVGYSGVYISPGSTLEFTLTCFSIDQKQDYRDLIGWDTVQTNFDTDDDAIDDSYMVYDFITAGTIYSELEISRYTIRFVLNFTDDNGQSKNIVVQKTVYFGNYDNC